MERSAAGHAENLRQRIESKEALVAVVGLGYVGLPLALAFAEAGFTVLAYDTDPSKVDSLQRGESYILHLTGERLASALREGRLSVAGDPHRLAEPDALLICVPTPLSQYREPDLGHVQQTAEELVTHLRPGQLVVLESTTYPGTTEELVKEILGRSGLACGREFFLAYSPEREDPGNVQHTTGTLPKVVGGIDEASTELACTLYGQIAPQTVVVSSAKVAEATKLTENIFRAVNIALVNELKVIYDRMGIDIWEVLDAAETKPFGFMRFNPGPGWGGHCIPVDPFYLSWKARELGLTPKFIELAGEVNVEMPRYVVEKLQRALNAQGKAVRGSKVLVVGLAYKKDVADPRESPAFEILQRLHELGARLSYHDPFFPKTPRMRSWPDVPELESVPLNPETVGKQDALIIVTDHSQVDYAALATHAPLIVDARGVYRDPLPNVVKA